MSLPRAFPDQKKITYPLRLGRKQKRAILDAEGIEVVVFPIGREDLAKETVNLLNQNEKNKEIKNID